MEEIEDDFQEAGQEMPLDESERSSVTSADDSLSVVDESAHRSVSNMSNSSGPSDPQPVAAPVSPSSTRHSLNDLQRPQSASKSRPTDANAGAGSGARRKTIDSTGVLRRLVIRENASLQDPELLAGLLEYSEPLEITFEDCSCFDAKLEVLELIAAHCPRLVTLKLYRCGNLLTQCFESPSPFVSTRAMEALATGLDFSHLRVLALHALPAVATSTHACLLEHLADRLAAHLLQLDLSDANLSSCASFEWLSRMRHLRVLLLANCQLPKERAPLVAAICELRDLVRLDLEHLGGQHADFEADNDVSIRVRASSLVLHLSARELSLNKSLLIRVLFTHLTTS